MKSTKNSVQNKFKTVSNLNNNNNEHAFQDPIEIICRIKPITDSVPCISVQSATHLSLIPPVGVKQKKIINYKFNHIFTEKSFQKEVFDNVAKPLLKRFIQGENGLLLTYGVTGSGKTYTMCGEPNNLGIIPRSINTLFNCIGRYQTPKFLIKSDKLNGFEQQELCDVIKDQEKHAKMKRHVQKKSTSNSWKDIPKFDCTLLDDINKSLMYTIFVNYVEIYNNNTYDLLDDSSELKSFQAKILREDCNNNIYVNGVMEIEVKTADEAIQLYCIGNKRKRMGQTSLNSESSRSHSIFTIRLVINNSSSAVEKNFLTVSQLSLVDLAGSERCNRTNCSGQRLKESGSINNSLMALRTCLEILRANQKTGNTRMVPYRESRLTLLFKKYFEGEGNVKMIICVNPSAKDYDETVHVMKFSETSQEVMVLRPTIKITELENEQTNNASTEFNDLNKIIEIKYSEITSMPMKIDVETSSTNIKQSLPKIREINPESNDIQSLILALKKRPRHQISNNIKMMQNQFRLKLVDLESEKNIYEYESQCKILLSMERAKVKDLKNKLIDIECRYKKFQEQEKKTRTASN